MIELDRGNCNVKQITLETRDYENIEVKLDTKIVDIKNHIIEKIKPNSNNDKILQIKLGDFKNSIERVTTVSLDRKEGLKMSIDKNSLQLSVNSPNSGVGVEKIDAKFMFMVTVKDVKPGDELTANYNLYTYPKTGVGLQMI